jgi:hypothetical protein
MPAADSSSSVCIPTLWRVTRFFHDAHLSLWQGPPEPDAAPTNGQSSSEGAALTVESPMPADDPDRPTLHRYDARTLLLRLPDLDMRYKSAVDSLVAARYAELTDTPTLVIDLRGDAGGCTCTYDALLPPHRDGSHPRRWPRSLDFLREYRVFSRTGLLPGHA